MVYIFRLSEINIDGGSYKGFELLGIRKNEKFALLNLPNDTLNALI